MKLNIAEIGKAYREGDIQAAFIVGCALSLLEIHLDSEEVFSAYGSYLQEGVKKFEEKP